jgi:hypothetical protein
MGGMQGGGPRPQPHGNGNFGGNGNHGGPEHNGNAGGHAEQAAAPTGAPPPSHDPDSSGNV